MWLRPKRKGAQAAPAAADTAYRVLADAACARLSAVEYERRRGSGQLAVSERTLLDPAIIGYPAVCCVLLRTLAGMWGAANYFVSVFRRHRSSAVDLRHRYGCSRCRQLQPVYDLANRHLHYPGHTACVGAASLL